MSEATTVYAIVQPPFTLDFRAMPRQELRAYAVRAAGRHGFAAGVPLNPVAVVVNTAYGISRKQPAGLRALYDRWASRASG